MSPASCTRACERTTTWSQTRSRSELLRVLLRRSAEHAQAAGGRPRQADREMQERRFAGAVRTDERGDAPVRNVEGAVAQRPLRAEALAEAVRGEGGSLGHAAFSKKA